VRTLRHELTPALEHYDLRVSSIVEIPQGFNLHYRVTTSDGPKHLIVYRPQPGKPPRDLQFRMRQHLLAAGFEPLPSPVPTLSGRPYARTMIGTVAVLDWVEGEVRSSPRGWPAAKVCLAARTLARFHRSLADFRPEPVPAETLAPLYLSAPDWLARAPRVLEEFHDWNEEPDAVCGRIGHRLDELTALFDPDAYRQALEDGTAVVHGDYRPANLVVEDGQIAGVLDLDAAFWESRVYDLAYACFQFAGNEKMHPQQRRAPAIAFARCYAKAWPLSAAERQLFPFFLRLVVLKRLLSGWDVGPRLALLDQLDGGLEAELIQAVA
jgi:Ser/Thr protein kinase RdoA (MazF antagonist)